MPAHLSMKTMLYITFFLLIFSCGQDSQKADKKTEAATVDAVPDSVRIKLYEELKMKIENKRKKFNEAYKNADSTQKDSIIKASGVYILNEITKEMFPAWCGTPWDFNGTTVIPKQGSIACGYFVTTVLQHSGFKIPRIKLAQCASEEMIKTLTKDIKRFSGKPVQDVISYMKKRDDGLYIVGLDSHTGFLFKKGDTLKFVHSNYYEPGTGVMQQELNCENPLRDSQYRVVGRILSDEMMRKWITEEGWE